MPGHLPSLHRESLIRLRKLVQAMHADNGRAVPLPELVQLAEHVQSGSGVTVDFGASRELGGPMIVLRVREPAAPAECLALLSSREREVAELIAEGQSNKQIAYCLGVSLGTVKDHVHHILSKTGLPNRAAVATALHGGSGPRGDLRDRKPS